MTKKILAVALFVCSSALADTPPARTINAQNYDGSGVNAITSTSDGGKRGLDSHISNTTPIAVSGTITTSPDVNVHDGAGTALTSTLNTLKQSLDVNISNSSVPASQSGTWNINNVSGTVSLPTGASTSALQTTGNASLSSIDGKLNSLGQKIMTGSVPVVISSDQSAISVSQSGTWTVGRSWTLSSGTDSVAAVQSGTWNINNISGTVSLPTGAATAANQTTANSSLSSIDGKLNSLGQKTSANSVPVVIASDQSVVGTKAPVNTTGSGSAAAATVSTVATLTAPANAVGFILMNLDVSTTNMRWAVGRTASTTLGQQLQPGRDTGFVPVGANISIIAESGTVTYDVQWVSQ